MHCGKNLIKQILTLIQKKKYFKVGEVAIFLSVLIAYPLNNLSAKELVLPHNKFHDNKSSIQSADEGNLRRLDYSKCVTASLKTPNGTIYFPDYAVREWKAMCADLKSDLGKEMRNSCYSYGEKPRVSKDGFCFNFNH